MVSGRDSYSLCCEPGPGSLRARASLLRARRQHRGAASARLTIARRRVVARALMCAPAIIECDALVKRCASAMCSGSRFLAARAAGLRERARARGGSRLRASRPATELTDFAHERRRLAECCVRRRGRLHQPSDAGRVPRVGVQLQGALPEPKVSCARCAKRHADSDASRAPQVPALAVCRRRDCADREEGLWPARCQRPARVSAALSRARTMAVR